MKTASNPSDDLLPIEDFTRTDDTADGWMVTSL